MEHSSAASQQRWTRSILRKLSGDLGAAAISATLVTPIIAIIDRALVEKSSFNQPLVRSLHAHTLAALRNPARFVFQVPFGLIWTLYAATYAVANGADTIGTELKAPASGMITFLSTTIVNVPLGVWKDLKYAQTFGVQRGLDNVKTVRKSLVQNRGVARAATAMFLARDSITIFGSFTLAPRLAEVITDDLTSHPHAGPIISQLTVPVLTQLVATPLHLFALDLYIRQHHAPLSDRIVQSQRYVGSTTVLRFGTVNSGKEKGTTVMKYRRSYATSLRGNYMDT
ncbi:hypothetical protein F1880_008047 [Penicillium rolfsii]|nr:hypothetical protein F1880_008047 [Penicillium rolfsii]